MQRLGSSTYPAATRYRSKEEYTATYKMDAKLDSRHKVIHTYGGRAQKVWMFLFCNEYQSSHTTRAEAVQAAKLFEKLRQDNL